MDAKEKTRFLFNWILTNVLVITGGLIVSMILGFAIFFGLMGYDSYEDVGTPFSGELCDCHDLKGDGYLDMTLKFSMREVVKVLALAEVVGETIPLVVTASLDEANGGTSVEATDCIRVLGRR